VGERVGERAGEHAGECVDLQVSVCEGGHTHVYAQCAGRHVNENSYVTNCHEPTARPMAKLKIKN
jgi:hypothetical protein